MPRWESTVGKAKVGTAVVDEKGRVLIPLEDRTKAGLKPGVELEISQQKQGLLLRPVTPKLIRVRASRAKWGRKAFRTPARPPLAARDKITIDVSTLAIFLVEDHPGNKYVAPQLEEGSLSLEPSADFDMSSHYGYSLSD